MVSLKEIGLTERSSAEIVLTTFHQNGTPHASAMGVRVSGESKVLLRIFTNTVTFQNLLRSGAAVINVVRDPEILAKLALKDLFDFEEADLRFKSSKCVNAPHLEKADTFVEIEIKTLQKEKISDELGASEVAHFEAEVKYIDVQNPNVRPLRRSESLVIESAILATKIMEAMRRGRKEIAKTIFNKLSKHKKRSELVTPDSKDSRLITKIVSSLARRFGWQE